MVDLLKRASSTNIPIRIATWLGLLGLCAAYLQGGLQKALDFGGAMAEMHHFGLAPEAPMAVAVIALELGASAMILLGYQRWLASLALAGFTLAATMLANRFWILPPGPARFMMANGFFEHLGLVGGFCLVAIWDWTTRQVLHANTPMPEQIERAP